MNIDNRPERLMNDKRATDDGLADLISTLRPPLLLGVLCGYTYRPVSPHNLSRKGAFPTPAAAA
jgi:hypothetical protein